MFILVHLDDAREAVVQTDAILTVKDQTDGAIVHINTKDGIAAFTIRERARDVFLTITKSRHARSS